MSTRKSKRPKAHSVEGQRLKRIAQRAALHDAICAMGEFMASNGIGSESNDWHTALDAARTSLPVDDSRPLALALTAAAYVVDLNGQRTTETGVKVLTLAAGVVGNPVPLWVFHLYQDVPSWVMQFGSHEMNVNNEACKSVAEHPEWAVARAAASLHLVASRAVSQALSECVARPIVGDDTTAQDLLVGEVGRFAEALARDLGVPWKAGEGDKQPTTLDDAVAMYGETVREAKDAGMFPWDEVLAKRLEVIGTRGREAAELVRNASRTTMAKALDGTAKVGEHTGPGAMLRQWNDPSFEPLGLRWIDTAAKVLWHDKVKPDRDRMGGAGLVLAPSAIVRTFGLAATKAPERKGDLLVYEPFDHRAAIINMAAARGLARAKVAQKPIFWRVIGYLLRTMEQQRASGAPVHNLIWTPTYDALRKSIGSASAKDVAGVRETLEFLEALSISNVARREAMFLSINTGAKQDGVAGIGLEIGLALRVDELARRNIELADDSPWRIPVLPFELIPTLSSPRSIGVGINAAQGLPLHFHDRRAEIAESGEVHIPRDEWHRYFDQQQVPHKQREKLLELFTSPRSVQIGLFGRKSTGAPLLVTGDRPEHYRFGPDFAPEWDHLVDQSQLTEDSTGRGRRSAEKRALERQEKIANKVEARAKAKR